MDFTILIPTRNEEGSIEKVVKSFKEKFPETEILVIDRSEDDTPKRAKKAGARVIAQKSRGKGNAIKEVLPEIKTDYLLMIDGDDTYDPKEAGNLIDYSYDMVTGSRILGKREPGSMSGLHSFGNRVISALVSLFTSRRFTDVLTGYRFIRKEALEGIGLESEGFDVETEMTIKFMAKDHKVKEVPITYKKRDKSSSKLTSFSDGFLILEAIFMLSKDYKPLQFFSFLGMIFIFLGLVSGTLVVNEYLSTGLVNKVPTAILSALFILFGMQFIQTGIILRYGMKGR
jgi:glycosyltransferase involved in cell wall biosynthesis